MKTCLKMASGEHRKQWHILSLIAILNYNTTHHSSIDCDPSRAFQCRVSHNFLDHNLGLVLILQMNNSAELKSYMTKPRKTSCTPTSNTKIFTTKKANASLLKVKDYCYTSAKSRPSRIINTFFWLSESWTITSGKTATEQYFFCAKA